MLLPALNEYLFNLLHTRSWSFASFELVLKKDCILGKFPLFPHTSENLPIQPIRIVPVQFFSSLSKDKHMFFSFSQKRQMRKTIKKIIT